MRVSGSCPRRRKSGLKLNREWVARGRKTDARPFGSARWAAFSVRADPNGVTDMRGRNGRRVGVALMY